VGRGANFTYIEARPEFHQIPLNSAVRYNKGHNYTSEFEHLVDYNAGRTLTSDLIHPNEAGSSKTLWNFHTNSTRVRGVISHRTEIFELQNSLYFRPFSFRKDHAEVPVLHPRIWLFASSELQHPNEGNTLKNLMLTRVIKNDLEMRIRTGSKNSTTKLAHQSNILVYRPYWQV
jgi:hypothetical protein